MDGENLEGEYRFFSDRDELINVFEDALKNLEPKKPRVLFYSGPPGIGKSAICEQLLRSLEGRTEGFTGPDMEHIYGDKPEYFLAWAKISFSNREFKRIYMALFKMRDELTHHRIWKIKFPTFDVGYTVYWRKSHPGFPLDRTHFDEITDNRIINEILNTGKIVPGVSLIIKVAEIAKRWKGIWGEWWVKRGSPLLNTIEKKEPKEIEEKILPLLFGVELSDFIKETGVKIVIFLDNYEYLWENRKDRATHRRPYIDTWVQRLVGSSPGVLWIILGREDIAWPGKELEKLLKGLTVEKLVVPTLSVEYCNEIMETYGVTEGNIRDAIFHGSKGVPLYVMVSIFNYQRMLKNGEKPDIGKFPDTYEEIIEVFTKHLDQEEAETLYLLSAARIFNNQLFEVLVKQFNTGYPSTAFNDFVRFSFIQETTEEGYYCVHDLLREQLKKCKINGIKERISNAHGFLYKYYKEKAEF